MKEKLETALALMGIGALLAVGAKMANMAMDSIEYLIDAIPNKKTKKKES